MKRLLVACLIFGAGCAVDNSISSDGPIPCGTSSQAASGSVSDVPGPLHFDHAIFTTGQEIGWSNPEHRSHPPVYSVQVGLLTAPRQNEAHYALYTVTQDSYAIPVTRHWLDLQTGALTVQVGGWYSNSDDVTVLPAPDAVAAGQDNQYFQYIDHIKTIIGTVGTLERDNNPDLGLTVQYLKSIVDDLGAAPIDGIRLGLPEVIQPGEPASLVVEYKASQPRDLLVDFLDNSTWYVGARLSVDTGVGIQNVVLALPESVRNANTTFFAAKILPRNAQWPARIQESIQPKGIYDLGNDIETFHISFDHISLHSGQPYSLTVVYEAAQPAELQLELVEADGDRVLTEARVSVPRGRHRQQLVTVQVPTGLQPDALYRAKVKLLTQGATSEHPLDQYWTYVSVAD